ncbi:MAG: DUF2141 domain-containing protein [Polyangiaceae bacterium]
MHLKRTFAALLALSCLAATAVSASADGAKIRIVVRANEFKNTKGKAIVAIYNSSDNWLKIDRAVKLMRVPIVGNSIDVTFEGMDPGVYGFSVIHDENENGKLDMRYFPIPGPVEGAGVSRDATATFGPPSWNDAKIRIGDVGGLIAVKVRY